MQYITNHGLGPYFRKLMLETVKKSPVHCLSFDESLNDITQQCKMSVMVRYWDIETNIVNVRYLDSSFFGHSKHNNLVEEFQKNTKELQPEKLFQISMDGPNVNLKFLEVIYLDRNENLFHSLINIGTCSLHSVNGSVKNGFDTPYMKIVKKLLKGALILLHSSPARRDDYKSVTGCTTFPLFFVQLDG